MPTLFFAYRGLHNLFDLYKDIFFAIHQPHSNSSLAAMLYISIFFPVFIITYTLYQEGIAKDESPLKRFFYVTSFYFGGYFVQLDQKQLFTCELVVLGTCFSIGSFVQMVLRTYDLFNMGLTLTSYNILFVFLDFIGFGNKVIQYLTFKGSFSISGDDVISNRSFVILGSYAS